MLSRRCAASVRRLFGFDHGFLVIDSSFLLVLNSFFWGGGFVDWFRHDDRTHIHTDDRRQADDQLRYVRSLHPTLGGQPYVI